MQNAHKRLLQGPVSRLTDYERYRLKEKFKRHVVKGNQPKSGGERSPFRSLLHSGYFVERPWLDWIPARTDAPDVHRRHPQIDDASEFEHHIAAAGSGSRLVSNERTVSIVKHDGAQDCPWLGKGLSRLCYLHGLIAALFEWKPQAWFQAIGRLVNMA